MSTIHLLPQSVIHAIAAGEVVERPAVVIKELLENALDAGAHEVKIWLEDAGLKKMVVNDDGIGMSAEDVQLAVQHHTTSKIADANDLEKIRSYGFRGEALASIASASRLTLQSQLHRDEVGSQLTVAYGELGKAIPVALLPGTTVIVEELFGQTPARRKFLKNSASELRKILEYVTALCLANPTLSVSLYHQQKLLLHLPTHPTLAPRAITLFGISNDAPLLPVHLDTPILHISGLLGPPQLARKNTHKQFLSVNGRPISDRKIAQEIKASFGSLLGPRAEPIFVLNLTLSPGLVDVNVHPRKETVTFMDHGHILDFVRKAITETLTQHDISFRYEASEPKKYTLRDPGWVSPLEAMDRTASPLTKTVLKELVQPWQFDLSPQTERILQVGFTYLVAATEGGVLIVDQHAAHERILYHQFVTAMNTAAEAAPSIELPTPYLLELTATDAQTLHQHLDTLTAIGFSLSPLDHPTTFSVTHVPALLEDRPVGPLLAELIDDLAEGKTVRGVDTAAERTLAYLACRSAVKAGDPLSSDQRQLLLKKLLQTPQSFTCPHGRPTRVVFTISDLEKMFHRR